MLCNGDANKLWGRDENGTSGFSAKIRQKRAVFTEVTPPDWDREPKKSGLNWNFNSCSRDGGTMPQQEGDLVSARVERRSLKLASLPLLALWCDRDEPIARCSRRSFGVFRL